MSDKVAIIVLFFVAPVVAGAIGGWLTRNDICDAASHADRLHKDRT